VNKRVRGVGIFVFICGSVFLMMNSALPGGSDHGKPAASQQQVVQQTVKPVQPVTPINKTIRVIYPNGGESLIRGKTYIVRWQSTGLQSVRLQLQGGPSAYDMTTAAASSSWSWKLPHKSQYSSQEQDIIPGTYKIKISDASGSPSDESDATFQVVLPEVDLECWKAGVTYGSNVFREKIFKIKLRNNGTRVLNDVLFNWVIKKNGVMVSQDGAGYGQVYPNTIYECEIKLNKSSDEDWRIYMIDFYLDPQNLKGEDQEFRGDNQLSFSGQSIY
jgi:hypothetical protein